jgi:hypothetical protein
LEVVGRRAVTNGMTALDRPMVSFESLLHRSPQTADYVATFVGVVRAVEAERQTHFNKKALDSLHEGMCDAGER